MLSKIADVATIALLVIAGYLLYTKPTAPAPPPPEYTVGQSVKVAFPTDTPTLVIVASTTCPHCANSLPMFKELAASFAPVALTAEAVPVFTAWLGIPNAAVRPMKDSGIVVKSVPSTFVIHKGKILVFEKGALSLEKVTQLRKALTS